MTIDAYTSLNAAELADVRSGTASINVTSKIQAAINAGYYQKERVDWTYGKFLSDQLNFYRDSWLNFADPGACMKMASHGFALRGVVQPGDLLPTSFIDDAQLTNMNIDMNGKNGSGLLAECTIRPYVHKLKVTGVVPGGFQYDDGHGLANYNNTNAMFKGIKDVYGCYHPTIEDAYLPGGENCLWFGTTPGADLTQRVNRAFVRNLVATGGKNGIVIHAGSDNMFDTLEVSGNINGIRNGSPGSGIECHRNQFNKIYGENNGTTLWLTESQAFTDFDFASVSGSSIILRDDRNPEIWVDANSVNVIRFYPTIFEVVSNVKGLPADYIKQIGVCRYRGGWCDFSIDLSWNSSTLPVGASTEMRIGGLPYEAAPDAQIAVAVSIASSLPLAGGADFQAYIMGGKREIALRQYNGTNVTPIPMDRIAAIRISGRFPTKA